MQVLEILVQKIRCVGPPGKGKKVNNKMNSGKGMERDWQFQLAKLEENAVEITPYEEFKEMLKKSVQTEIPLRVKCGIDPTVADIHLGHLVPYRKMRQFQDLGHIGIVIIGDYTAQIGDPSGKNETRPPLDAETVSLNAKNYIEQVFTVLDEKKTIIRYQSEWFNKTTLQDVMKWAGQTTVAKLFSHDTFRSRLDQGHSLGLHELFYPVLQGIDSVFVEADVELGGTDQKFNVMMGRDYQKSKGMRPQVAILTPIVTGICGTQKMSKSLGNYIGVFDDPFDKFGKIMSIPDVLMLEYFQYVTFAGPEEVHRIREGLESQSLHPNEVKKTLAARVVSLFHGEEAGKKMREQFEDVFAKGKVPEDTDEVSFERGLPLIDVLIKSGLFSSKSELRRLQLQNALSFVDGDKITDLQLKLDESHVGKVLKAGKRKFLKLK